MKADSQVFLEATVAASMEISAPLAITVLGGVLLSTLSLALIMLGIAS